MMAAMFAYVSGASFVLQDGFGLDARTFGLVFGLNAAGLTLTSQLNPVLLRRFRVRHVLGRRHPRRHGRRRGAAGRRPHRRSAGCSACSSRSRWWSRSAGLAMPNTPALALTRHGEAAGTAAAVLGCVQFGVGAVVAPLVGAFGSSTAAPMGAVMLGVTTLAARADVRRRAARAPAGRL